MGGETTLQERQKCESVQREPCFSCMAHVQREQLRGTYNMLIDVALHRNSHYWCESEINSSSSNDCIVYVYDNRTS